MNTTRRARMSMSLTGRRAAGVLAGVLSLGLVAGCDVTNPGPVPDEIVSLPVAQLGLVNGAKERLNQSVGWMAYSTALIAREIFPGGQTGSYGHTIQEQAGSHVWSASGPNGEYGDTQQARWIAEEAIRRLSTSAPPIDQNLLTQAYLWAGYANRVLGENYCESVIDGGPLEAGSKYFERAVGHFTEAIAKAPSDSLRRAAYAGRAQSYVWLKDWGKAVADAAQVPDNFNFYIEMDYTRGGDSDNRNHLFFANNSSPYRSYTVKFTNMDAYYTQSGDPRAAWRKFTLSSDTLCVGSLQGFSGGRVPCTKQNKYKTEDDDMRLASGREMRLIEAEARLVAGDIAGAMAKINGVRALITSDNGGTLAAWPVPATLPEAWTLLKRERGIELWLEARRLGDERRWLESNTPGNFELPNFEARSTLFVQNPRGRESVDGVNTSPRLLCYNISNTERNTNPNIPDVGT
jgi:starch-binding outer membrane protein, SusD/RagB family